MSKKGLLSYRKVSLCDESQDNIEQVKILS